MPDDFLKMGVVGRPHGIKGEISLDWQGDHTPAPGDSLWLRQGDKEPAPYIISGARQNKGRLLLTLKNIEDRTAAEALKGAQALLRRADVPPPAQDEEFLADLIGCRVFSTNGEELGVLDHLEFPAGHMIWSVIDPSGKEILFPAREEFIDSLDTARGEIIINPPDGLLDIYRA